MARSTAEGACALRAARTLLRDPAIRNPDHMASDFIAPGLKLTAIVKVPGLRRLTPRVLERILPGALWFGLTLEEDLGPDDAHERILHHAGEPYGFGGMALARNPSLAA